MLAAVIRSPGRVATEPVAEPTPGPGQARVRLQGAGVCASELPVWQGREWFSYPRRPGAPGHEGWGVVDAVGSGVEGLAPGQRVAIISERAHAELDLAPAEAVVPLPFDGPFPGEPLACAVNAFERAQVVAGERVAIVGAGFQALLLTQLCAPVAGELAVISRRQDALERARGAGAQTTWRYDDPGLGQLEERFDVVVEATGHQAPLDLAARLARVRGRLIIVGYHQDGPRSVDMQLWNWRGLDVVNAHERDPARYAHGLRGAVAAVAGGRLELAPLLTHRFTLEELGEAYRVAAERPPGFVKAMWLRDG